MLEIGSIKYLWKRIINLIEISDAVLDEAPQSYNLLKIEQEIFEYWEKNEIMEKSFLLNEGKDKFSFLEGPPTANGPPHLGNAETRAMKDLFLRYKTMKGFHIDPRIAGWDCHGLPVEIEVEKSLGIKNKSEIEKMGIYEFNKLCRESVFTYVQKWEDVSKRLGYWVNYGNAYVTMRDEYIESEWWALKELYKKNLLFKDFRISPYCPRCETTLSTHEVSQGYREIEDYSIYVKFKVVGKDEYFLVWTTTPWTLPANQYLAVNPDFFYLLVDYRGEKLWIAEERLSSVLKNYKVLSKKKGSEIVGERYEQLIPFLKLRTGLIVVSGDFVTQEDGSGIVHQAPAFGADDYAVMKKEKGELYITVNESGKVSLDSPWKDMGVLEASDRIIDYLKESGQLLKAEKAKHTYPFCWRCNTRLIYYPVESWYIGVSRSRDKVIKLNQEINWKPEYLRDGRFGNFLDEGKDWALSRNRFWGTPLPVWTCEKGHIFVPGSKKELFDHSVSVPDDFDLHRPKVDEIEIKCSECSGVMKREPYPIDTWFDSGSAFFAQFHYPFENKEAFEQYSPVDFISEAIDQTRGWFYSMHVISSLLFGKRAFSNVVVMEFILNSQGEKMSKSKGDTVDTAKLIEKLGTDTLRLFFFQGPPWKPKRFAEGVAVENSRKLLGTLYNSYLLFSTNARLDRWTPKEERIKNHLDKWLYERTNQCISLVTKYMDDYEPHQAVEEILKLTLELSQWYLRLSRDRFWNNKMNEDKKSSYYVTYYALESIAKVLAPFVPYFSEYLFKKLTGMESVHLTSFPKSVKYDSSTISDMNRVKVLVEAGRRIRQKNGLILRRPVSEIIITDEKYSGVLKRYESLISKELNTKRIKFDKLENYKTENYRLNRKSVGRIFGKELGDAETEFHKPEKLTEFSTNGETTILGKRISKDDVLVEERINENYVTDSESQQEILINKEVGKDLYLEGLARDIVRRIQSMRKEVNLDYTDKIYLSMEGDESLMEAFSLYENYVLESTQATIRNGLSAASKKWDISGMRLEIKIEKMEM